MPGRCGWTYLVSAAGEGSKELYQGPVTSTRGKREKKSGVRVASACSPDRNATLGLVEWDFAQHAQGFSQAWTFEQGAEEQSGLSDARGCSESSEPSGGASFAMAELPWGPGTKVRVETAQGKAMRNP